MVRISFCSGFCWESNSIKGLLGGGRVLCLVVVLLFASLSCVLSILSVR